MIRNLSCRKCCELLSIGLKLSGGNSPNRSHYYLLIPDLKLNKLIEPYHPNNSTHDIVQVDIPWPISKPIYGDGWRGYGRLITPTMDMTTEWLSDTGRKAIKETAIYSRLLMDSVLAFDSGRIRIIVIDKSIYSGRFIVSEIMRSKYKLLSVLEKTRNNSEYFMKNGIGPLVASTRERRKELKNLIEMITDPKVREKLTTASKITKDRTVAIVKNSKLPGEVYRRSNEFVFKTKENSKMFYANSVGLSKNVLETAKKHAESNLRSLSDKAVDIIKNLPYLRNLREAAEEQKSAGRLNKYTQKLLHWLQDSRKVDNITKNILRSDKSKSEVDQRKQPFHTNASSSLNRTLSVFVNPSHVYGSNIIGQISDLIPAPVKKIWQGLRDKRLPKWQTAIANTLRKLQDSLMKKK